MLDFVRKHWRWCAIFGLAIYVGGIWWWTLSGFPAQEYVCGEPHNAHEYNCAARQIIAIGHWIRKFHDELLVVGTFLLAGVVIVQIRDARISSERQLRAYVVIDTIDTSKVIQGTRFKVEVTIKNAGQTPAYDVKSLMGVAYIEYPPRNKPGIPPDDLPDSTGIIGPGGQSIVPGTRDQPFTELQVANLKKRTHAMHIIGRVTYRDAFGEKRFTNFNAFYGGPYGADDTIFHAESGNDAN